MKAVRIKRYKISKAGPRGLLSVPGDQLKNLEIEDDGEVTLYAGVVDGKNVLIIAAEDHPSMSIGE